MRLLNKMMYVTMLLTIIFNVMSILGYPVMADSSDGTYTKMMEEASDFIAEGAKQAEGMSSAIDTITEEFVPIGRILTTIGAGILVAATTFMGIKYITTTSPEAQAKLKQQLIGLVVSAIVIFGAYGIWQMVGKIAQSFEN